MARPKSLKSLVAFTAGEMTPKLDARADTEKYQSGCRAMQNMWPLPHGAATRRRGLGWLAAGRSDASDDAERLLKFQFSRSDRMMIRFCDLFLRFHNADGTIVGGGTPYEIASPYSAVQGFLVQASQFEDVVILTCPGFPPYILTRLAVNSWTLAPLDFGAFGMPPMLDENVTAVTVTPGAATGSTSLTASSALFSASHIGAYFRVNYLQAATFQEKALTGTGTSTAILVAAGETITAVTHGTWKGTVVVQTSPNNSTWTTIRSWGSQGTTDDANYTETLENDSGGNLYYRLNMTAFTSSTNAFARITVSDQVMPGLVKVTAFTSSTVVTVTVVKTLFATSATTRWTEGAFSDVRGYPAACCFFQQRLWFGGTTYEPQDVWGSVLGGFYDFTTGTLADDAINFTLSSTERNQILWMVGQKKLIIGTSGGAFAAYGDELEAVITATKPPLVLKQNNIASAAQWPLMVNNAVLFVQQSGRKLREMVFDGSQGIFTADDLALLSDHITAGGLTTPAYQGDRDSIAWFVTGDGVLVGMTYDKSQNVIAWHRHTTGTADVFESVETLYNDGNDDDVWVCVLRDINGTSKRFIERFHGYFTPSVDNALAARVDALARTVMLPSGEEVIPNVALCPSFQRKTITMTGDPAQTYAVPVTIKGVMETGAIYSGGAQGNGWYVGGVADTGPGINIYKLTVSSPSQFFFLNPIDTGVSIKNYTNTINIKGGATVTIEALSTDGQQAMNSGDLEVPGLNPGALTQPYNGQFFQVQFGTATPPLPPFAAIPAPRPDVGGQIFLDSSVLQIDAAGATVVTGLGHLEGMLVEALADGNWVQNLVVVSGQVTLPTAAVTKLVGLPIETILQPMRLDTDPASGNSQGLIKRIHHLGLRLMDTGGIRLAKTPSDAAPVTVPLGAVIVNGALFTGDQEVTYQGDYDEDASFVIRNLGPHPMTILGVFVKYTVTADV